MKPRGTVLEAAVGCDFSQAGLEDGLDDLNQYILDKEFRVLGKKCLYIDIECDLLQVIDLSRAYCLQPSFKKDYKDGEWSIHALDLDNNYSHIVYWSPGA